MAKKKTKIVLELTRRDFLTVAGAAAGSMVLAQLATTGPLSPFSSFKQEQIEGLEDSEHGEAIGSHHWGMVINLDKCIGCEYCLRACTATNDVATDKTWNIVVPEQTSIGTPFSSAGPACTVRTLPASRSAPSRPLITATMAW